MVKLNLRAKRVDAQIAIIAYESHAAEKLLGHLDLDPAASPPRRRGPWLHGTLAAREVPRLPEHELFATVLAQAADGEAAKDDLSDVDSLVLVIPEKGPSKEVAAWLRTTAERAARTTTLAVLVDLDAPDASAAASRVATLDVPEWQVRSASSSTGLGVGAFFDELLTALLAQVTEPEHDRPGSIVPPELPRGEGNPLLTALRRVLEASIETQVKASTQELLARLDRSEATLGLVTERLEKLAKITHVASDRGAGSLKALDALASEQKKLALNDARRGAAFDTASAAAESATRSAVAVARQVQQGDDAILHALRDSVVLRLDGLAVDLQTSVKQTAEVDMRIARVEDAFAELIEELKKPKRGWFG